MPVRQTSTADDTEPRPSPPSHAPRCKRFGRRSKAGYLVCKPRRIKCDELESSCRHCIAAGWPCRYISRDLSLSTEDSWYGSTRPSSALQRDTALHPNERRALCYFFRNAAADLFGYLLSDLWTCLVPQRCHSVPVVRSAVVALSSIHRDFAIARDLQPSGTLQEGSPESLRLYGPAVNDLRIHIAQNGAPLKAEVLLSCAALICFDLLQGIQKQATQHLNKGIAVVHSWSRELGSSLPQGGGDGFEKIFDAFCALDIHATACDDERVPNLSILGKGSDTETTVSDNLQKIE